MTKEDELERNIAAAKIILDDYPYASGQPEITTFNEWHNGMLDSPIVIIPCASDEGDLNWWREEIDIFTNPAVCLAVVKKLGDKYGTSIVENQGSDGWHVEGVISKDWHYNTCEEAVGAAVMEIDVLFIDKSRRFPGFKQHMEVNPHL